MTIYFQMKTNCVIFHTEYNIPINMFLCTKTSFSAFCSFISPLKQFCVLSGNLNWIQKIIQDWVLDWRLSLWWQVGWQRKTCWYTWKKCILSLGDCDWCPEKLSNFRFELNRRNRAMEINAICDDIPNIHGIRYIPPPNYADVIYLPNYEEAMQIQFQ